MRGTGTEMGLERGGSFRRSSNNHGKPLDDSRRGGSRLERVFRLVVWGNRLGNGKVELGGYPRVGGEGGGG